MRQMDTGTDAPGVNLLFADFIAYLHRQGFIIGVDHHLRLQTVLNKLGPGCKPGDLKFLLCPIFATDKRQQRQFYRSFDAYFKTLEAGAAGKPSPGDIKKTKADETPGEPVKTRKWPFVLAGIVLIVMVALVSHWLGSAGKTPITPEIPIETETARDDKMAEIPGGDPDSKPDDREPFTTVEHELDPSFERVRKWVEEIERLNNPEEEDRDGPTFYESYGHIVRWVSILAPFIFLLLLEIYRHNRRRLMLEQQRGKKPPLVWPIKVENPEPALVKNEQFYQAARLLRERLKSDVTRLDVDKTITSSIQHAGFPVFQYKAVTRPPEYLILIDLPAYRDHYAHLFDSIANALENEGLFVQRYFYEKDPRVCFKEPDGERFYLSDLKTRYTNRRLIVFGDGEVFLDPMSGELDKWTALFRAWGERAVLTPERPRNWGMREVALARKFIVLPASLDGLGALKTFFDTRMKPDLKSRKKGDSRPLPPGVDDQYDMDGLRAYLGEDTFQWLCACAVYPELQWDLTLYIGSLQCMPAALIREENVLRMIRLPWFRTGSIPDGPRWELTRRLDPDKSRAVRAAIVELLEKNPAPKGSYAYDTYRLHLVLQRWMLSRKDRKRRREMLKAMKRVPEKQIIQDYTRLQYRETMPGSRLNFILPKRLKNLFYRKGIPLFGFKAGIRVALTVLIAAVFFMFLKSPRPPVDIGSKYPVLVSLEGGVFFMGPRDAAYQVPRREVTVESFAMGKYEVTNARFAVFLNERGNGDKEGGPWLNLGSTYTRIIAAAENRFEVEPGYENHPVAGVGWHGAMAYCDWLMDKTLIPFRLPTEAEWEYACRAGKETEYSFGDGPADHEDHGWFDSNAGEAGPREVGGKADNPFGLFDMHGNMWEWCLDGWSDNHAGIPKDGTAVPPEGKRQRVLKGGSWKNPFDDARSAHRIEAEPELNTQDIGFRVAASLGDGLKKKLTSRGDKIQIFGSPLGMYSLLGDDYIISVLKEDGSLNREKLNEMVSRIAHMGANALRDYYWIDSKEAYEKISPFWYERDRPFKFNDRYFENQREIAKICNRYGMRYYLSIFDHCGTKRHRRKEIGAGQWNPWRNFKDYFYGKDAEEIRHRYIDRLLAAFKGLDVGLDICNEPKGGAGEFLADTFIYLIKRGFEPQKIIIGIDYHLKEKGGVYSKDYVTFRNKVANTLGRGWNQWLKSRCISPVHNATIRGIDDLWGGKAGPGGTRRILYSQDGVMRPRPTKDTMYQVAKKILDKKTEAREKGKVHFEVVCGKTFNDPLDAIEGVSAAYLKTWGRYPANYGKYPQPVIPEEIEDEPGPDDEFGFEDLGTGRGTDEVLSSTGTMTVRGTYLCDLDKGKETQKGSDFWWEQVDRTTRYIVPRGGAKFRALGIVNFNSITHSYLKTLTYSSSKINGSNTSSNQIPKGTVVASVTNEGRYCKFRIDKYGYNLIISWVTYAHEDLATDK